MWWALFLLGITGSLHCVGMCGPLAMLVKEKNSFRQLVSRLLYHVGKAVTYTTLSVIMSMLGGLFLLRNFQNSMAIIGGVLILGISLTPSHMIFRVRGLNNLLGKVRLYIARYAAKQKIISSFFFGLLNGLLPCGLVYAAIVIAAIQPSIQATIICTLSFSLGVFPILFISSYSLPWIIHKIPFRTQIITNTMLVIVALVIIGKGVWGFYKPLIALGEPTVCP